MTRHRAAVTLYAGQDEFRDLAALSERLSRSNAKETTLDYAERRGLAPHSEIVVSEVVRERPAEGRETERGQEGVEGQASPSAPRAARSGDSLREKVEQARARDQRREGRAADSAHPLPGRDATEPPEPAAPEERRRESLRRELRKLDGFSLGRAVEADRIRDRDANVRRAMTVADAARLVSPTYAAAAERLAELRKDIAYSKGAIETYGKQRDFALDQGDARWKAMGTMRQYGHRTGVRPDHAMSIHERDEASAAGRLAAEEKRRDERMTMLPAAERAEADALERVRPEAGVMLAQLQERAELAREVQQEKMQVQRERGRERQLGREQDGRDGMER